MSRKKCFTSKSLKKWFPRKRVSVSLFLLQEDVACIDLFRVCYSPFFYGAAAMTVKDTLQELLDDGLVDQEKVGSSNYFWAFPSKGANVVGFSLPLFCSGPQNKDGVVVCMLTSTSALCL